jgi:cytochrome c556
MAQRWTLLLVFVAAVAAAGLAPPQIDPPAQPAPVLENVDLMDLMVKPAYDELRQAAAHAPADRREWAALYQKAARLAEVENLLFFRTRAGAARQAEWAGNASRAQQASADVAAAALRGLRSARATDFADVRAAFPAVAEACTACHGAFSREAPAIKP